MFFNINNVELEIGKCIFAVHDASCPGLTGLRVWPCTLRVTRWRAGTTF